MGASKILENKKTRKIAKVIGASVLVLFGFNIILNGFGINFIPGLNLGVATSSLFLQGLVLTLSSPMTIALWSSVLTVRIVEEEMTRKEQIGFSIGLVSATFLFLTMVAVFGSMVTGFISENISNILNVIVGLIIILFGVKLLFKKDDFKK